MNHLDNIDKSKFFGGNRHLGSYFNLVNNVFLFASLKIK